MYGSPSKALPYARQITCEHDADARDLALDDVLYAQALFTTCTECGGPITSIRLGGPPGTDPWTPWFLVEEIIEEDG